MTADREALVAEVAGILAQHREDYSEHCCWWHGGCNCGWTDSPDDDSSKSAYDTHLADALADLLAAREQQARAEALREAAGALDSRRSTKGIASRALDPGVAMSVAFLRDEAER